MNVIKKDKLIIVSSYPIKLACLCLIIIFANLLISLTIKLSPQFNILAVSLGMILPTLLLFVIDYRLTVIDVKQKLVFSIKISITGKRKRAIKFSQIKRVITKGWLGIDHQQSAVCIETTHADAIAITAHADASKEEQSQLISTLNKLFNIKYLVA